MGFWETVIPAVASGAGNIVGSIIQNDMNRSNADHSMDRSAAMSREQMAFQERMSNSAWQRATKDMTAAGINPMVAFQQGGASSPQGAQGTSSMARSENIMNGVGATAMEAVRLKKDLETADSGIALNQAMSTKALADTTASGASAKQMEANTKAVNAQLEAIAAKAKADAKKAQYDLKATEYDAVMNRVNRDSNSAKNLLELFKPKGGLKPWEGQMKDGTRYNKGTGEIIP